jgi:eukaryotic-like serine/threonine-protein kinase
MKSWLKRAAIVAGVITGSAILFLLILDQLILPAIVEVPMVTVPDLRGQTSSQARERVSSKGLRLALRDSVHSEKSAIGSIVEQDPSPGQRIKRARRVFVDVSRGRRLYPVPDVSGGSQREAGLQIQSHQLAIGNVRFASHTSIPKGVVISQYPEAAKRVTRGTSVDLRISSGSPFATKAVPDLIGLPINTVEDSLLKYEMALGTVDERTVELLPPGQVLSQSPEPGAGVLRDTAIDLVVSVRREATSKSD